MRTLAGLLVVSSFGLGFAGAVTLMVFTLVVAIACDFIAEVFDG